MYMLILTFSGCLQDKHGCMALVQDDAHVDRAHASTPALLHPGQREPGESHPTQDPLPAGLRRQRLSL